MQVIAHRCIVAAALLLWGWRVRLLPLAGPMAVVVLFSALAPWRLVFGPREFARLWDLTIVLIVAAGIYQRQTSSVSAGVLGFLQWLPILFYPFVGAFFYSTHPRLPRGTFLFWWRKNPPHTERGLDVTYPYLSLCLLSASAASTWDRWFYPSATVVIVAAIWANKPRRVRPALAMPLLVLVAGLGYLLQSRWRDFQSEFENRTMAWISGFFPRQFEDQETYTNLGEIGKLKQSARVVIRVAGPNTPRLLRQVSFDQYRRGIWLSTRRQYAPVREVSAGSWTLAPTNGATNSTKLVAVVPERNILLPLPNGAWRARDLPAARLERNRFGNVRAWDAPDPIECMIDFDSNMSYEPGPDRKDLQLISGDDAALEELVRELQLQSLSPSAALERLAAFFNEEFRYLPCASIPATDSKSQSSVITEFLLKTRAGHCEYFATAAALLLRKARIPARYALGYAVVEPAGPGKFQVRERHAHSWVLAYVNGRWQDFDPTPHRWSLVELRSTSALRPLADRWADLRFRLATQQWMPHIDQRVVLGVLIPAAAAALLWIVLRRRYSFRRQMPRLSLVNSYAWPGLDSDFFDVERFLAGRGLGRHAEETAAAWVRRVMKERSVRDGLSPLVLLHYKYRFDPCGLSSDERQQLAAVARDWLATHQGGRFERG
ncbi:MAG: transglutaminase-like domain-containing protein [Verrucomicrobia subdivision 3 bacterium]|nr:transglutaminase-like domain-containing protein [Limisphaerales bacterium]